VTAGLGLAPVIVLIIALRKGFLSGLQKAGCLLTRKGLYDDQNNDADQSKYR